MGSLLGKQPLITAKHPSSFRDPSGFIFEVNGSIYRQINKSFQENYDLLVKSGLYDTLTASGYLIAHQEVEMAKSPPEAFKIIQPKKIPFISYPYEWSFSMLKDAALLTLSIQKIALQYNMSLKDASAFNIQFLEGKPILIDTLSFEEYKEGKPWVAYKQFVEHFLTPLALMSLTDIRLNVLTSFFLDGVPVDLASQILPLRSRLNLSLLFHIFAHSSSQKRNQSKKLTKNQLQYSFKRQAFSGLLDSLEGAVKNINWNSKNTQWSDYYQEGKNNYNQQSFLQKGKLVKEFVKLTKPKIIWDVAGNTGFFSRIAGDKDTLVISFDLDHGAIEKNYLEVVKNKEKNILPLFVDLTNPTPSLGWANQERLSILERGPADVVLALALVHHLAIANNLPFAYIASLFSQMGKYLIIEFVPKTDSQVQILLANREDIFSEYSQGNFEKEFRQFFQIKKICPIAGSKRVLYLMEKR